MKIIPSLRRCHYVAKVSIFLITAALIAGMVGCGPVQYNLTIFSTEGGTVTTPGAGTFTYDAGTVVDLVAEADWGYQFVNWIGNASVIADVNAAATNITMNGDCAITANFTPEEIPENLEIRTWYDLDAVRDNLGGNHTLMNDLDSTTAGYEELAGPTANLGKGWQPIGIPNYDLIGLSGSFDGQGHEIRDLFINRPDEIYVGLFGIVDEGGRIENIGVVTANVTGVEMVGGLVGYNHRGTVNNCYAMGSVNGNEWVGGLVGSNYGTVSNSYYSGSVTSDENVVGGLVGYNDNQGTVSTSYATSSVTGNRNVGGLVGHNHGTVSNSYATGTVVGNEWVGGLLGTNGGTVNNSYATGNVTGDEYVGGLVGWNSGPVGNSYSP